MGRYIWNDVFVMLFLFGGERGSGKFPLISIENSIAQCGAWNMLPSRCLIRVVFFKPSVSSHGSSRSPIPASARSARHI